MLFISYTFLLEYNQKRPCSTKLLSTPAPFQQHQNLHGNSPTNGTLTLGWYLSEPQLPVLASLWMPPSVTPPYTEHQREIPCWTPTRASRAVSEKGRLCHLKLLLLQVLSQFYNLPCSKSGHTIHPRHKIHELHRNTPSVATFYPLFSTLPIKLQNKKCVSLSIYVYYPIFINDYRNCSHQHCLSCCMREIFKWCLQERNRF